MPVRSNTSLLATIRCLRMIKTLVLTSSKNYRWMSMQEIIPFITESWLRLNSDEHIVEVVDVDKDNIFKRMKEIISFDNIVCTCFTVEISRTIATFRKVLGMEFKTFFYVHGQATIGLWPLLKWAGDDYLTSNDYLVVSCERDIDCLNLAFKGAKVMLHPFLLGPQYKIDNSQKNSNFIYIGRVSEQKNLHSIILAIKLIEKQMREHHSQFTIIGGTDDLGTPVTGTLPIKYLEYLKNLVSDLSLNDLIEFRGHIDREQFNTILSDQNAIFISSSLHSDENFGVAPYQYLKAGGRAILSDWGGYAQFKDFFEGIDYLDVYQSSHGHFSDISQIARVMEKRLSNTSTIKELDHSLNSYLATISDAANKGYQKDFDIVCATDFAKKILRDREDFYKNTKSDDRNHGAQIFTCFKDQGLHQLTKAYGAKYFKKNNTSPDLIVLPMVELKDNHILITDPHRGGFEISRMAGVEKAYRTFREEAIILTDKEVEYLFGLGYVISFS